MFPIVKINLLVIHLHQIQGDSRIQAGLTCSLALKSNAEEVLNQLEADGLLEKVTHSDWADQS